MIGFLIGTVCLVGLVKVMRHRFAYGHGGHGGCGHGYAGGWGGWGGGWGGHRFHGRGGRGGSGRGRWFLRQMFERLETTPGQEKVIAAAVEELRESLKKLRPASKGLEDLASALRAESFDEAAAAKFNVEAEEMFSSAKGAMVDALRKVHEVLDPRQRALLADMLERRATGIFGGFGPYRGGRDTQGWV